MNKKEEQTFPKMILDHHRETLSSTLLRWQKEKTVPPTLLLTGPIGGGTEAFARHLAQWFLCEKTGFYDASEAQEAPSLGLLPEGPPAREACEICTACKRFQKNQALDLFEISPQASESGKSGSLKIDQLDFMRNHLGFGPKEAAFKIFILQRVDLMTPQASNSLLKVLEEPPPHWIFVLTTSDPSLVLPTIVSRCQVLRLKPVPPLTIERVLVEAGLPSERVRAAIEETGASFEKSLRYSEDSVWEVRSKIRDFLKQPKPSSMSEILDWASSKHEAFVNLLDQLDQVGVQLLTGAKAPRKDLEQPTRVIALMEKNFETRARLLTPVNRKLLAQDLLSQWCP